MLASLFNKVVGVACSFIKKRFQHRCFLVKFGKFLRTPILRKICERLLLQAEIMLYKERVRCVYILGDSRNYMPPILVSSSAKRIATQILVIAKLNGRKDFILRVFVCDIIRSKELPIQI